MALPGFDVIVSYYSTRWADHARLHHRSDNGRQRLRSLRRGYQGVSLLKSLHMHFTCTLINRPLNRVCLTSPNLKTVLQGFSYVIFVAFIIQPRIWMFSLPFLFFFSLVAGSFYRGSSGDLCVRALALGSNENFSFLNVIHKCDFAAESRRNMIDRSWRAPRPETTRKLPFLLRVFGLLLYCPAVVGQFSPASIRTDRAVRIQ